MRFNYGEMNALRALEESEFWKNQESEHTQVIQEVVPDLEEDYVEKLIEYKGVFDSTLARIVQYIETIINLEDSISLEMNEEIMQIIKITIMQSQVFIDFLNKLLKDSSAVGNNPIANVVINHIRRESDYYIGVVKAFLDLYNDKNNRYSNFYKPLDY
ncbi:hypothetical protein J2Z76_000723 [Sedimentibacter acidaminivorans]|uniref:DUF2935 domain-containing protein n=1 Tax=Sedimentibacter acidaminivorans TaxID=913099 RepID=A0ABS4GB02_9FIRM|nr:DUF2935 domain-containing protein [Sedimentibacter acidaminivorans]MBP1924866.1 hypothetical protein [Sedimentibacter acidaminivorans]